MTFKLSQRSKSRLTGVHPDLVKVVERAILLTDVDFMVTEGLRTKERQAELVKAGKSQTMNSRHLTGHAVDLAAYVNGQVSWDKEHYYAIARAMLESSRMLGIQIVWGGNFKSFFDGPHFELDRKVYG